MQSLKLNILKYKIKNNFITYGFKKNSKKTYAEIFGVNAEDYADTIIVYNYDKNALTGNLSNRARKDLERTKYNTFDKILLLSPSKLRDFSPKFAEELENWIVDTIKHESSKKTYAEIFGVNAEDYADTIITYNNNEHDLASELSARACNALKRAEYNTLEKLLSLTPSKLRSIQNLGSKSVDEIEAWIVDTIKHESSKKTYAEIFGVNAEDYADTIITYNNNEHDLASELSVRARNALKRTEYDTLEKLLLLTPSGLYKIQNLGGKSVEEIESWLERTLERIKVKQNEVSTRKKYVLQIIKWRLQGYENSIAGLTSRERVIFAKAMKAVELFGNDFCLQLMTEEMHPYIETITEMFKDFNIQCSTKRLLNDAKKAVSTWKPELLSKLICPYLYLFCMSNKEENNLVELESLFATEITVGQYTDVIADTIKLKPDKILSLAKVLNMFQNWMIGIDLDASCKNVFKQDKENKLDILHARAAGNSLEEIGKKYNVTRERIRQIEEKSLRPIKNRLFRKNNNLFLLISAHYNGDCILFKEKIAEAIGTEYANILWYYATITKNKGATYFLDSEIAHYDANYRAIIVHNDNFKNYELNLLEKSAIQEIVDEFPELIKTAALQEKLYTIAKEGNLPWETLKLLAAEQYKEMGICSYKGPRLTLTQMCDFVLQECFQNGYKVDNKEHAALFQKYLIDFFGREWNMTIHALDTKISRMGVLINRGKYVHQKYIHIDDEIVGKIFDYIETSHKTVISDSEIFLGLKNIFQGTIITNRYALHGIIKLYNTEYILRRDYISKNSEKNLIDEFVEFMKLNGEIHKSEILEEFGWRDYNLVAIMGRCSEIVDIGNGYFMHDSRLNIDENISNNIRQYLETVVGDIPISVRRLQDYFMANFRDFMVKNEINNKDKLFGILQYMFAEEYQFSRPYICKNNIEEVPVKNKKITSTYILHKYLENRDTIEIPELIYICEKSRIKIISTNYIIDSIAPEFIRINDDTLTRFENIGITEEMYQDIAKLIFEAIEVNNGYISARNIDDFSCYPMINVPWTPFLLESIAKMIPTINIIKIPGLPYTLPQAIFVSDKYANENWESLLIKLLQAEHDINPFISRYYIYAWLKKEGLCGANDPPYIKRENHVFYDNNGKLKIE